MPATNVHFNGGVNLADTQAVMREIARRVPHGVRRIPDGEPGDRSQWILFQAPKFVAASGLEPQGAFGNADFGDHARDTVSAGHLQMGMRLREGVDAADIQWPNLGYADAYLSSFEIFRDLKSQKVIPDAVRFQVEYPTPLAPVTSFVIPEHQDLVEPSYERALTADLARLLAAVPHEQLAVQWDVSNEFALLSGALASTASHTFDGIVDRLARCVDRVPQDVPAGFHLCYGDFDHHHFADPQTLQLQVDVAGAISAKTNRAVGWFAFTIPQHQKDPAYFAPLRSLRVKPTTELNFALVPYHPAQQEAGTTAEQARLLDEVLAARELGGGISEWGICTECGMARAEREDIPQLLDLHREILAKYGGKTHSRTPV
jgi:hypothetical protein